jgi:hypothetical protein
MSTVSLTVELPRELFDQADRAGLLTAQVIADLLAAELRRRQVERLFAIANRLAEIDEPPLDAAEVEAEVRAARFEKRARQRPC